ncbi:DHHA1 domain-containing protein, partial [Vibrio owensii]
ESANIMGKVQDINGTKVLIAALEGADNKNLRTMVDDIKNQVGSGVILLANVNDDKIGLIAGVTKDLIGKVKAGDLVKMVAEQVGGKGGGRPDMAQAGGTDVAALPAAIQSVQPWLEERL